MAKLRPLEKIFSITNNETNKQVCILGIKFRIDLSQKHRKKCLMTPIVPKKIVFMNYLGKPYGCNPKYIVEEINKRNLKYDLVWIIANKLDNNLLDDFPPNVRFVKYKSKQCLKEMASAKIWVSNYHFVKLMRLGLLKKKEQVYIQTWHGSLGIKKIEKNVKSLLDKDGWLEYAKLNSRSIDYWISNSKFETEVYKEAFWDVKKICEFGHARNDIFYISYEKKEFIRHKVLETLGIAIDKKILLYVPTFRDGDNFDCYDVDFNPVINALSKKFGGDWVVVTRMHPHFKKKNIDKLKFLNDVVVADKYPDIQELLLTSDVIITDYSSCIFDFMLSRKPGFIFATDIDQYNNERGFYYPLESTPFPIATNNDELIKNIENFDYEKYKQKVEEFLKDKGCMEDGHASERVVDLIEKIMSGEVNE